MPCILSSLKMEKFKNTNWICQEAKQSERYVTSFMFPKAAYKCLYKLLSSIWFALLLVEFICTICSLNLYLLKVSTSVKYCFFSKDLINAIHPGEEWRVCFNELASKTSDMDRMARFCQKWWLCKTYIYLDLLYYMYLKEAGMRVC